MFAVLYVYAQDLKWTAIAFKASSHYKGFLNWSLAIIICKTLDDDEPGQIGDMKQWATAARFRLDIEVTSYQLIYTKNCAVHGLICRNLKSSYTTNKASRWV